MKITINLLPLQQKIILRAKYIFRIVLEQQLLVVILLVLVTFGLLAINYLLKLEQDSLMASNAELVARPDYAEILVLHEKFAETNKKVEIISSLQMEHIQWSDIMNLLSNNIPSDISVREFKTDAERVTLSGVSQRVDSLVAFQNSLSTIQLEGQNCFLNVDVPDRYLVKSENVDFVMTFRINVNDCMKENYE